MLNKTKGYRMAILGLSLSVIALNQTASAACNYVVTNAWGSGFTAAIRITNDSAAAINGWQVSWAYSRNTVSNAWNATLSGSYTATNLGWNAVINPGQTVEFGMQGVSNGGAIETPAVTGSACGSNPVSSISSSIISARSSSLNSSSKSSIISSSPRSSSNGISSSRSSSISSNLSSSFRSSSVASSPRSSSSTSSAVSTEYTAITTQYEHEGINASNAMVKDSAHFRIYYGGGNKMGPKGNLGTHSESDLNKVLAELERAYDMFVVNRGFKSPGQSITNLAGKFKINVYSISDLDAGGYMGYNGSAGLSYLIIASNLLTASGVTVHEFGHGVTLAEKFWVDKARTGAWWETVAEWFADTYQGTTANTTIFDVNSLHAGSNLNIVHKNNLYQAWPFMAYLTNNPDGYAQLGNDAVKSLMRAHQGQETPLHTLERMIKPTSIKTLVGRYRARMAYGDIGHSLVQQRVLNAQKDANFRTRAYRNLESIGADTYRVLAARKPQYTGSNIIPLQSTGSGDVNIQVTNLGNGLSESNFTAVVAIKASNNSVRYLDLPNGTGSFRLASGEEASLVVTNTPDSLYLYNAFDSVDGNPEYAGLNYQVQIIGAKPRD